MRSRRVRDRHERSGKQASTATPRSGDLVPGAVVGDILGHAQAGFQRRFPGGVRRGSVRDRVAHDRPLRLVEFDRRRRRRIVRLGGMSRALLTPWWRTSDRDSRRRAWLRRGRGPGGGKHDRGLPSPPPSALDAGERTTLRSSQFPLAVPPGSCTKQGLTNRVRPGRPTWI